MFCPNCGSQVTDGARFCGNCGMPLDSGATAGQSQASGDGTVIAPDNGGGRRRVSRGAIVAAVVLVAIIAVGVGFIAWRFLTASQPEELLESYVDDDLASEYGWLATGATTEMSPDDEDALTWLQSGVVASVVEDLDGDDASECMAVILKREDEDGEDGVALYANVYEVVDGEVILADSACLGTIYDSSWYLQGWNGSLADVDGSTYFIFEKCTWPNTSYATEIGLSISGMTYSVVEEYVVYAYDGESLERVRSFQRDGGASGGVDYYEYEYEDDEVSDSSWLYSSIVYDGYDTSDAAYDTYVEAMEYFAGCYGLSIDESLMSDTGRSWSQMSESVFSDSDGLTRLFAYSVLADGEESPYTYEQTLVDYTDEDGDRHVSIDSETSDDGSDEADESGESADEVESSGGSSGSGGNGSITLLGGGLSSAQAVADEVAAAFDQVVDGDPVAAAEMLLDLMPDEFIDVMLAEGYEDEDELVDELAGALDYDFGSYFEAGGSIAIEGKLGSSLDSDEIDELNESFSLIGLEVTEGYELELEITGSLSEYDYSASESISVGVAIKIGGSWYWLTY